MKILHLTLKRKWFDMIGNPKDEEYRDYSNWLMTRLFNKDMTRKEYDAVKFRNGYHPDSPTKTFKFKGFEYGIGKTHWGASGKRQVIIKLGERI